VSRQSQTAVGAALAALLAIPPAAAQDQAILVNEPARGGPLDRFGRIAPFEVQITAGTEDGTASVGVDLTRVLGRPFQDGAAIGSTDQSLSLILATPTSDDGEAAPATLDGLANGTSLTLRWSSLTVFARTTRSPPEADAIVAEARRRCERKVDEEQAANRLSDEQRTARMAACAKPPGGPGNLVGEYYYEQLGEYNRLMIPANAREFGLEGSVGRNSFEFVDPATLAAQEETKIDWRARAFYTQYLRHSYTAFTAFVAYEHAYEEADESVFCPASPTNIVIKCTTAAGAPPELNESLLLAVGLRHQFNGRRLSNVAVAPQVAYDALDDVWGIDVPVYLVPNSDNALTGGFRVGYRSDRDDEFSVGIFIGAAFDIFD